MSHFIIDCECVIEHDGKLLVIERPSGVHGGGLLAFPGGKLEPKDGEGESNALEAGARRELEEEVGIRFKGPLHYVTSSMFPDTKLGVLCVAVIFHGICVGEQPVLNPSKREVVTTHWLTRTQLINHPLCPSWMKRYAEALGS